MSSVAVSKRIAALDADFEALLAEPVDGSTGELTAAAHAWECLERRLAVMRHRLVSRPSQTTRLPRTQWIPPPNLDWGHLPACKGDGQARVNNYHHPERYLIPDEHGEAGDENGDAPS